MLWLVEIGGCELDAATIQTCIEKSFETIAGRRSDGIITIAEYDGVYISGSKQYMLVETKGGVKPDPTVFIPQEEFKGKGLVMHYVDVDGEMAKRVIY